MRLAADAQAEEASRLLRVVRDTGWVDAELATAMLDADQSTEAGLAAQRARVVTLKGCSVAF